LGAERGSVRVDGVIVKGHAETHSWEAIARNTTRLGVERRLGRVKESPLENLDIVGVEALTNSVRHFGYVVGLVETLCILQWVVLGVGAWVANQVYHTLGSRGRWSRGRWSRGRWSRGRWTGRWRKTKKASQQRT